MPLGFDWAAGVLGDGGAAQSANGSSNATFAWDRQPTPWFMRQSEAQGLVGPVLRLSIAVPTPPWPLLVPALLHLAPFPNRRVFAGSFASFDRDKLRIRDPSVDLRVGHHLALGLEPLRLKAPVEDCIDPIVHRPGGELDRAGHDVDATKPQGGGGDFLSPLVSKTPYPCLCPLSPIDCH
jgi:hypothetical protein